MKIRIDFYSLAEDEDTYGSVYERDDFFHLLANSSHVCFYITWGKDYPYVYISKNGIKAELKENIGTVIKKE
jgi:hypothetical protein